MMSQGSMLSCPVSSPKPLEIHRLPKTELHLHLEGAVPHKVLLELIEKYGGKEDVPDEVRLAERLAYRDFPHFLDTWQWMCQYVRELEDFTRISQGVATKLASQHVQYAELHFSPPDFLRHGLSVAGIAKAVRLGLNQAGKPPEVALIIDLGRGYGPEQGGRWLAEAVEVAEEAGIVGIGLGGPEQLAPPEPYADVFRLADSYGFRRVAHAGEAAGPESIWGALLALGAERIGHGTRAVMDQDLLLHLRDQGIPVEVCPTSNVCTGVVPSIEHHPIRRLFDFGVRITLSSDDPTFFGTDINREYQLLRDQFGFTDDELVQVARTGFEVAFLPEERRKEFLRYLDACRGSVPIERAASTG